MTDHIYYAGELMRSKHPVFCWSYAYYKGRNPEIDENPTQGGYRNNFGTHLAAIIRGAQLHVDSLYKKTKRVVVWSDGNRCRDVHLLYDELASLPIGPDVVVHYIATPGKQYHKTAQLRLGAGLKSERKAPQYDLQTWRQVWRSVLPRLLDRLLRRRHD